MSELFDPNSPKPRTRREALEKEPCERGFLGGREIRTTATEPLPDIQETGYRDVVAQSSQSVELKHRGFVIGTFTMVLISLITFFAPGLNALLGGVFGGFFAKRWGRAFAAAAVASVMVPAIFAFFFGFDTPDFLYLFYGLGFWGWTALHVVCMFIGAAAGVYSRPLAERRRIRREVTVE